MAVDFRVACRAVLRGVEVMSVDLLVVLAVSSMALTLGCSESAADLDRTLGLATERRLALVFPFLAVS
jgi:hypothetical protein